MNELHIQIGDILSSKRQKKNLSLEKISNVTKISVQNLSHIESGNLNLIVSEFYQKSFIRSYAKALRISDKQIMDLFEKSLNKVSFHGETNDSNETTLKSRIPLIKDKIPTMPLLIFAFVGLSVFYLISFIMNMDFNKKLAAVDPKPEMQLLEIDQSNNLIDEIENLKSKQQSHLKQTNINLDDIYNLKNTDSILKQIIAKEDVWVEIKDNNNNILISTILNKDESFVLPKEDKKIVISTSNAGAVFLKNGDGTSKELGIHGATLKSVDLNNLIANH